MQAQFSGSAKSFFMQKYYTRVQLSSLTFLRPKVPPYKFVQSLKLYAVSESSRIRVMTHKIVTCWIVAKIGICTFKTDRFASIFRHNLISSTLGHGVKMSPIGSWTWKFIIFFFCDFFPCAEKWLNNPCLSFDLPHFSQHYQKLYIRSSC